MEEDRVDWFDEDEGDAPLYTGDPFIDQHLRMVAYRESLPAYWLNPWHVDPDRAAQLAAMPYGEYLETGEWDAKRRAMLRYAGRMCQRCSDEHSQLHVHHRTYERRGHENKEDLEVLCEHCHRAEHGIAA